MDVQLKKRITHLLAMEHLLKQTILHTEALLQDLKKPLITKNFHEFIKIGGKERVNWVDEKHN